jgi:hypothetical protein
MTPTWKPNAKTTHHRDGTVSYFSVYAQTWTRERAAEVPDRELSAMSERDRRRVIRTGERW